MDFRTQVIKAKNVEVKASGSNVWFIQRVTSVLLFLIFFWFVYFCYSSASKDALMFLQDLKKPYNFLGCALLVLISFYHGLLGMEIIVEDYIHNLKFRYALIIWLRIFTILTVASFTVALIYLLKY